MKNTYKAIIFVLTCSFSHATFAGKWVNWNKIAEDITNSITSVVEFVSESLSPKQTKIVASGTIITKEISLLSNINTIDVSGAGTLIITQDNKQNENLLIETDEAIMPYIEILVTDKKLAIKIQDNTSYDAKIIYRVNLKNLINITLSGAMFAELDSIKTQTLTVDMSGASQLLGDINVTSLMVNSSGVSKITLVGKAAMQNLHISGSCKFDGTNLISTTAVVYATGASSLYCNISDSLSGHISGASSLYYANTPNITVKSSGVASIQKL